MNTTVVNQSQTVAAPATSAVQYQAIGAAASERLNTTGAKTGGIIQLACAGLSVILGIVSIAINCCYSSAATPIWCGVLFHFPAGVLGVVAAKQKSPCPIIGCMVMSILSAIFSVPSFSTSLASAVNENECFTYYEENLHNVGAKIVVDSILTVVAAVGFVTAIYTSAVMCGGTNCCTTSPRTTVVVSGQSVPATTTQVIQTGYQQYVPAGGYQHSVATGGYQTFAPTGGYQTFPPTGGYQQSVPPTGVCQQSVATQYGQSHQSYQDTPASYQHPAAGYYPPNTVPTAPPRYSETEQKL